MEVLAESDPFAPTKCSGRPVKRHTTRFRLPELLKRTGEMSYGCYEFCTDLGFLSKK